MSHNVPCNYTSRVNSQTPVEMPKALVLASLPLYPSDLYRLFDTGGQTEEPTRASERAKKNANSASHGLVFKTGA